MPPESVSRQSRLYLDAARRHLAEASVILNARPEAEHGSAAEEAALLIALAQAEATLSAAGILAEGVRLSDQATDAMEDFQDHAGSLAAAIKRLVGRLDDLS